MLIGHASPQTYDKYSNVFRLVVPAGRQYLFQAHTAEELNAWLHAINYAAALKSAGLRVRPLVASTKRAVEAAISVPSLPIGLKPSALDRPSPRPPSPPLQAWTEGASAIVIGNGHHHAEQKLAADDTTNAVSDSTVSQDQLLTPVSAALADLTPRPLSSFVPLTPRPESDGIPQMLPSRADQLKVSYRVGCRATANTVMINCVCRSSVSARLKRT